jgi:PAT family beta-lactamase induction signal transducer AmpG
MRRGEAKSWKEAAAAFLHPRVVAMLFLGFSAGIPILMIFSSLSLWLREAGVDRASVTFFSWAALGYSFKFVWAPLVDKLPVPLLTVRMGRRRAWMLVSQCAVIGAILWMAFTNPAQGPSQLVWMALGAVLLGFSSATQDIVIDAYRIESAEPELQALLASTYIAGYRIAMIVSGAGALYLASVLGSSKGAYLYSAWQLTYTAMAGVMLVGVVTTLVIDERPPSGAVSYNYPTRDYLGFLALFLISAGGFIAVFLLTADAAAGLKEGLRAATGNRHVAGFLVEAARLGAGILSAVLIGRLTMTTGLFNRSMVREGYVEPVRDFFSRYGAGTALLLLSLVGLYRISDIVLGVISNVFYQDLGFTKVQIAGVVKTFGVVMTIAGGFVGGVLAVRFGVMRILFLGGLLAAATNLLFMALARMGDSMPMLYVVISADNLAAGLASAAFVAFLSALTSVRFTAVQYAVFSSLMTLVPKMLGGYSGTMVDAVGYPAFFLITFLIGIPVLALIWLAGRRFELETPAG